MVLGFLLEVALQAASPKGTGLGWISSLSFPTHVQKRLFLQTGMRSHPSKNILHRLQADLKL